MIQTALLLNHKKMSMKIMKKKFFIGVFSFVLVLVATLNIHIVHSDKGFSGLLLSNIEALGEYETTGTTLNCWQSVSYESTGIKTHKTYCGDCSPALCSTWSNNSTCIK